MLGQVSLSDVGQLSQFTVRAQLLDFFSVLVLNSSLNNRKSVLKSPPFSA
jgi:hypothetical protein